MNNDGSKEGAGGFEEAGEAVSVINNLFLGTRQEGVAMTTGQPGSHAFPCLSVLFLSPPSLPFT